MRNFKNIFYTLVVTLLMLSSCTEPDNLMDGVVEGGLLELTTGSVNYVIGSGNDYTIEYKVLQSTGLQTTKVDAYIVFHSYKRNADGSVFLDADESQVAISSNEKLLLSMDVTDNVTHFKDFTVGLADIISGLSVAGNDFYTDLPSDEAQYLIGDNWEIRLENTLSDGSIHENSKRVSIAVSTRFAGIYTVQEGEYFRLGADNGDGTMWVGGNVAIKSIDAITYQFAEWGILSGWSDNVLYFQINAATGDITYPKEWPAGTAQTLNGEALTTPIRNASDLTNVIPIAGVNINKASADDVEGKDELNMCHGYYTSGSGPREFYFLLQKKVD